MILNADFYARPALELAPLLLGKMLCKIQNGGVLRLRVTETEAYCGVDDTACHAHRGKTPRNSVMFGPAGVAYVYLCYGIHRLLNIVAAHPEIPEAVLIRGVEGYSGPGRLTKHMGIGMEHNGAELCPGGGLWLEDDGYCCEKIAATPRIGISYAAKDDIDALWRFVATGE